MTFDRETGSAGDGGPRNGRASWLGWLLAAACTAAACAAAAATAPASDATAPSAPFAKVGDVVITHQEFETAFAQAARSKFYHAKPPEDTVAALQREVAQGMVDEILLAKEAARRKLQPDRAGIQRTLDQYEEKYRGSEQWKANRTRLLPGLRAKLERDNLREQLSEQVKHVAPPSAGQLEQYWKTHQDKFTSPEQVHMSMILLAVDPAAPQAKWDGARNEGAAIVKRLKGGADFKQLAQLHSGDGSAQAGGDMGYVHRGMLPEPAQAAIDKLKPGEVTEPVALLEGVAVFRLHERKAPKLNALDTVRERAQDLWMREKAEAAWVMLLATLRRQSPVKFDESRLLPLASASAVGANNAPR
jgi:parvulin-like peptidyl-prolyl isomerase